MDQSGAEYAFESMHGALGIQEPAKDYDVSSVAHSLSGALASKNGYDKSLRAIEIYVPKDINTDCVVNYTDKQKKNLFLFQDPYANCFVHFLISYYRSIAVISPRCCYDGIDKWIKANEAADVLFFYNTNTFMTDNSLADILTETEERSLSSVFSNFSENIFRFSEKFDPYNGSFSISSAEPA